MNKKSGLLLVVWLLSFSLTCTRDKNPISANLPVINPDGKAMNDMDTYLYLDMNGQLWSWGLNVFGQAGQGSAEPVQSPTPIGSINHVIDFDTREGISIAADAAGNIWVWGFWGPSSYYYDPVLTPKSIAQLPGVIGVDNMGYLLRDDGTVWEINKYTQILENDQLPEKIPGIDNIINLSGDLAVDQNGQLKNLTDLPRSPESGGYTPINNVTQVQNSISHSVVLKTDGTVWAWGQNKTGELGNVADTVSAVPVRVNGLDNIVQISVRYHFNLALKDDGSVWFWGYTANRDENNKPIGTDTPERVETTGPVANIQAGINCMLIQQDGTLWTFDVKDRVVHKIDL